jgi:hypothetical protein
MRKTLGEDYSKLKESSTEVYCMIPDSYAKHFNLSSSKGVCLVNLDNIDTMFTCRLDHLEIVRTINSERKVIVVAYLEIYGLFQFHVNGTSITPGKTCQYRPLPGEGDSLEYSLAVKRAGAANDD